MEGLTTGVVAVLLGVGGSIYIALRFWRDHGNIQTKGKDFDFRPSIGFTRVDGWKSVALLLDNKSTEQVWTEEIEIALTDLDANEQAHDPTFQEIHKIRQSVRPSDMLPISLVEPIYNAAGRPQRKYTCVLSSMVRYRVGEKWYAEQLKTYKLYMAGLTVNNIRRDRKTVYKFKFQEKSQDLHTVDISQKR